MPQCFDEAGFVEEEAVLARLGPRTFEEVREVARASLRRGRAQFELAITARGGVIIRAAQGLAFGAAQLGRMPVGARLSGANEPIGRALAARAAASAAATEAPAAAPQEAPSPPLPSGDGGGAGGAGSGIGDRGARSCPSDGPDVVAPFGGAGGGRPPEGHAPPSAPCGRGCDAAGGAGHGPGGDSDGRRDVRCPPIGHPASALRRLGQGAARSAGGGGPGNGGGGPGGAACPPRLRVAASA